MKFLIIFTFLAAGASLGLAEVKPHPSGTPIPSGTPTKLNNPSGKPIPPTSIVLSTTIPSGLPSGLPSGVLSGIPPALPTSSPSGLPDTPVPSNSTDSPFADAASRTANNPISELLKLSTQCQAALLSVVANPEFLQCVPIPALLPLLPVLADPNELPKLLKDPVHTLPPLLTPVFDGICAAPKCSDKGVSESLQAVVQGCKKDANDPLIVMITGVITFYSPLRDTICFKTNKKEYCVFDTLEKVLSLPPPPVKFTGTILDNIAFAEPKQVCTPCNKAIVNTVFNFLDADKNHSVEFLQAIGVPTGIFPLVKLGIAVKCGFQFLDGKVGDPGKTDPDNFEYQLLGPDAPAQAGAASNLEGFGFVTMIGALLASTLMI